MNKLFPVGKISERIAEYIGGNASEVVYQSSGLSVHIASRHPDCVQYIPLIPSIIKAPDYIGVNPRESVPSFELVKCLSENIQIGIKFDLSNNHFYVATLYTITDAKLAARIQSGRLVEFDKA